MNPQNMLAMQYKPLTCPWTLWGKLRLDLAIQYLRSKNVWHDIVYTLIVFDIHSVCKRWRIQFINVDIMYGNVYEHCSRTHISVICRCTCCPFPRVWWHANLKRLAVEPDLLSWHPPKQESGGGGGKQSTSHFGAILEQKQLCLK